MWIELAIIWMCSKQFMLVPGWQTPSGLSQVPVQMQVVGIRTYPNGTVTNYNHIYQYVDFQPYVNDPRGVFEVSFLSFYVYCVSIYLRHFMKWVSCQFMFVSIYFLKVSFFLFYVVCLHFFIIFLILVKLEHISKKV